MEIDEPNLLVPLPARPLAPPPPEIPSAEEARSPSLWLKREYLTRRARNPYYSLRAFSRTLGLSSGRLSELLSGKRGVSVLTAERIAERLDYAPDRRSEWMDLVRDAKERRQRSQRLSALARDTDKSDEYSAITNDQFYVMADWYHMAILSLLKTDDFKSDPRWIARRLNIAVRDAGVALQRLERLGLIRKEGARWVRCQERFTTTHDLPSAALRRAHKQGLELAGQALENIPVEERDVTSMVMAISPDRIGLAKQMIKNFRRALADLLEEGEKKEVYLMTIALFPVTTRGRKK